MPLLRSKIASEAISVVVPVPIAANLELEYGRNEKVLIPAF